MFTCLRAIITALLLSFALSGCMGDMDAESLDPIDRAAGLTRDDFKSMVPRDPKNGEDADAPRGSDAAPIPEASQILVAPRPPKQAAERLVSIAVTEDIPLRDVLIELARLANVDLELDPSISGGIIFRAKDRPLRDVIDRIAQMENLRYEFDGKRLKIEQDRPYLESYTVDFLNMTRSSESSLTVNTNVLSASGGDTGGGGGQFNTGSNSSINVTAESDLWVQFEEAIKQILDDQQQGGALPAGVGVVTANAIAADGAANPAAPVNNFFVINRQGGLLTVFASQEKQDSVAAYIEHLKKTASAQVLIEAKIVEVTLNDEYRSGIDWESFALERGLKNFDFDLAVSTLDTANPNVFSLRMTDTTDNDLKALVNLTEEFGTSRTLSSPRLHAINNQQAVLTFAENQVYFEINVERETNSNSANNQDLLTVDSEIKTVPIGIILVVQPSINLETNEVTLNVRPTLSRVTSQIADPAVAFLASQATTLSVPLENLIPVVEVRELDTIMKVRSGDVMVMGGLMEERSVNTDAGVPYASNVPFLGNLFKRVSKDQDIVEMVIFVKATIIPNSGTISQEDIDFYRKFTSDPRPLTF